MPAEALTKADAAKETLINTVHPELVEGLSPQHQGLRQAQPERGGINQGFPKAPEVATASAAPNLANAAKTGLDFELADGQRFVRLSDLPPQPTVINFWRYDCPPCLREMPLFAVQAESGNAKSVKVRIVTVALHRPAEDVLAPAAVRQALTTLQALYGPSDPRGLLARFGNPQGALPHTVILNTSRQICARRTGEIDAAWLDNAIQRCSLPGERRDAYGLPKGAK